MQLSGKKHYGETVSSVVLKDPSYVMWMVSKPELRGYMAQERREAIRLIRLFDARPLQSKCSGSSCALPPTRLTAAEGRNTGLYAWCDGCSPYQGSGKVLSEIRTYCAALRHNELHCGNTKAGQKRVILAVATAKGLVRPLSEANIAAFFA